MNPLKLGPIVAVSLMLALPAAASANYAHVVMPGETLTSIAATDGLSISALAAANGLSSNAQLITGSVLQIPPQTAASSAPATAGSGASAAATGEEASDAAPDGDEPTGATGEEATDTAADGDEASTSSSPASVSGSYVVQPGDTLTAIAQRDGTTVAQLAATNGLNPNHFLVSGTVLALPQPGSGSATTSTTRYVSSTTSSGGPYPTPQTVNGPEIAGIASANGVPAPLAQAIGWQESGWNNSAVSPIGAVGVMQIVPSTWSWIQSQLAAGSLSPNSASDNVRGGVLLLHSLLSLTGSPSMAAAGYYQGLASIRAHGLYPSTRHYVNDVMSLEQHFAAGGG
jgi:LysM repeat protein